MNSEAGRALAPVLPSRIPGGSGDVEVGPGLAFGELLKERRGVDGSRLALGRSVDQVRDLTLGQVLVFVVERQAPDQLAGPVGGFGDRGGQVVVIRKEGGIGRTESDQDGTGEGSAPSRTQ